MAQKFNDGQTFGSIREILNDNANEINAINTELGTLAYTPDSYTSVIGRVESLTRSELNNPTNPVSVFASGNITYTQPGIGVSMARKLQEDVSLLQVAADSVIEPTDVLWWLNGYYTDGWFGKNRAFYQGFARASFGMIVAYDTETGKTHSMWHESGIWVTANSGGGSPTGAAGGDLTGTYPNPTIKSSVNLPGSPTTTTQGTTDSSTKIATTAFVKNNNVRNSLLIPNVNTTASTRYMVYGYGSQYGAPFAYGLLRPFIWKNLDAVGICLICNASVLESNNGWNPDMGYYTEEYVNGTPDGALAICIPKQTFFRMGPKYNSQYPPKYAVTYGAPNSLICYLEPSMILPFADLDEFSAAESVDIYSLL